VIKLREERGFTMIEMVTVCIILGVILAGITTVFVAGIHSEANLDSRFQGQQTARLAIDAMRIDAHSACAANVLLSNSEVVLAGVPNGTGLDISMCGAVGSSGTSYPKVIWCALTSPTISTQYALYRSTASDGTCTKVNGKLVADNLTSSVVFTMNAAITVEQLETFVATISVARIGSSTTTGAPYKVSEPLTLRNSVYTTANATTYCSTSDNTVCYAGECPFADLNGTVLNLPCYPPLIKLS
jgi:prepilin-type N-terminal cleavage/methylation domain-containing protein